MQSGHEAVAPTRGNPQRGQSGAGGGSMAVVHAAHTAAPCPTASVVEQPAQVRGMQASSSMRTQRATRGPTVMSCGTCRPRGGEAIAGSGGSAE